MEQSIKPSSIVALIYIAGVCIVVFAARWILVYTNYIIALLTALSFLMMKSKRYMGVAIAPNIVFVSYCLLFVFLLYNYSYSYSAAAMRPHLLRYCVFLVMILIHINFEFLLLICSALRKTALIIAIVYIGCYPIWGADSGIIQSYQFTAATLSAGLGLYIPRLFSVQKMKTTDILSILIIIMAILLTGKRTLFIIPIAMIAVIAILSNDSGKSRKVALLVAVGGVGLGALFILAPSALQSIQRLLDSGEDMTLNSRTYFWDYAMMLWRGNTLWGIGFGCFPTHIVNGGVDLSNYGYIESSSAHNIYYQLLAETGLIGFILFIFFFVSSLVSTFRMIINKRARDNPEAMYVLSVSFYLQCWFLLYGFTGNPLYVQSQVFAHFLAVLMSVSMKRSLFPARDPKV